jgi:hypothetical protein
VKVISLRVGGDVFSGGAWHPELPRIGVPGILTESALMDQTP